MPFKLTQFSTRTLLKHKVHIGSNLTNLNSTFFRYGFFQWDLTKRSVQIRVKYSLYYLKIAVNVLSAVVQSQGTILIIQEQSSFSSDLINLLKQTRQPLALRPWLPGTLSNFRVLRQTYLKVFYLKRELTKHFAILYEKLNITANTKKYVQAKINVNKLSKELIKYVDSLSALPHLVILGNSLHSHLAVNEARLLGIPSLGLIDSNGSVFAVNYFIPWNNKSLPSLALFFQIIALTILKGRLLIRQTFLFKIAQKKQIQLKKQKLAILHKQLRPRFNRPSNKEELTVSFLKQMLATFNSRGQSEYLRNLQAGLKATLQVQRFQELAEVALPIHLLSGGRWFSTRKAIRQAAQQVLFWEGTTSVKGIIAKCKTYSITPSTFYAKLISSVRSPLDQGLFFAHVSNAPVSASSLSVCPLLLLGAVKDVLPKARFQDGFLARKNTSTLMLPFPQVLLPKGFKHDAPKFVRLSRLV